MLYSTNPVNNIRVIIDMGVTIKPIREKASKNKIPPPENVSDGGRFHFARISKIYKLFYKSFSLSD